MFHHFRLYLKSAFPSAVWSEHCLVDLMQTENKLYLVANLSAWPSIVQINRNAPFPKPITPILLADCAFGPQMPKGTFYVGGGTGLTRIIGGLRAGSMDMPVLLERLTCGLPDCMHCRIMGKFDADYPCWFMEKYEI